MKRVLITGATSFLGRELAGMLMAQGVEVHAVVRPGSQLSRFDRLPERPRCHVHDGSAAGLADLAAAIAPDTAFHLAGSYLRDHRPADVDRLIADNVTIGAQVLEAIVRADCRRLVVAGSYFQFMSGAAPRAVNLYAATKLAFESLLSYYRDAFGLAAATLIIFDTYGPTDWRPRLMAALRDAVRNGTTMPLPEQDPVVDLVFGSDVAAAFIQAAELLDRDPAAIDGGAFAITSGERLRLSELAALFGEIGGRPVDTRPGAWPAPPRGVAIPWSGPPLPGWRPTVPLRQGIRIMLDQS